MSDRLTVVFDDPNVYRQLKVRAAEEGVPMKRIVEDAVQRYLGQRKTRRVFTAAEMEEWMHEVDELEAAVPAGTPANLSDIKQHLYGRSTPQPALRLAEESASYDA